MRLMMKSALERMLDTEMDVHLGRRPLEALSDPSAATATAPAKSPAAEIEPAKKSPNRRDGRSKKTVRNETGDLTIATPRGRTKGTFYFFSCRR